MRIKEFRAYRPPYHLADQVAGPPYDVLDCEEARVIVSKQGEKCFLRVNRPEVDLPNTLNPYDRMVYETGARNLEHFISQGWLAKDNRPSLYIYGQRWGDRVQYGLCAGVSVHDYAVGKIKKHEETQVVKEDDRTRLVLNQNANISPVLLAYQDCEAVNAIIQRVVEKEAPVARTQSGSGTDLVEHMVWAVSESVDVQCLCKAFEDEVPHAYIADGHHRSASAYRVGMMKMSEAEASGIHPTGEEPFNWFLAALFPASQLSILSYNRVVRDLNGLHPSEFLEKIKLNFDCEELPSGKILESVEMRRQMGMCLSGTWYLISPKDGTYDASHPVSSLDVQILYDNILRPILGIQNPREHTRISYVGGVDGGGDKLHRLVTPAEGEEKATWTVAFLMHPVDISQIMAVSDARELMTPKSTWFEPKLMSGLIVQRLDEC